MHKIPFILLLHIQASISSFWRFESTNELCKAVYKCNCSEQRKLVDCSSLSITELTDELKFSSAENVFFQNNQIQVLKKNFGEGGSVKLIDVSHNRIHLVASFAFSSFPNLERLDLSHNSIWNLGTDMLAGLESLRELDLSYNNIQGFFDIVFKPTPQLRKLLFKFNPIVFLDKPRFAFLSQLEYLDLQCTGLLGLDDDVFFHNLHLKYLSLGSNGLEEVPTRTFRGLRKLLTLDLSDNPIVLLRAEAFKELSNLTTLYLNRMRLLETIKNNAFQNLINLRTFHCSYNYKLSEIEPLAFASNDSRPLKNIEVVNLRDNSLLRLSNKLLKWNSLYHLDLNGNPWHCDCNIGWMADMHWKHELQYNIRCASPEKLAGKLIGAIKRGDFKCQHYMSAQLIVTLTLITAVAFSAVLAAIGVFMSRKGWFISCRSKIQTKYHQVSRVKDDDIDYEPKE